MLSQCKAVLPCDHAGGKQQLSGSTAGEAAPSQGSALQPTCQVSGDSPSARNVSCWGTLQPLVLSGCEGPKLYALCLWERFLWGEKKKKTHRNEKPPLTARKYSCLHKLPSFLLSHYFWVSPVSVLPGTPVSQCLQIFAH